MLIQQYEFSKTSKSIQISVSPIYMEECSAPIRNLYTWGYTVKILNLGKKCVQLLHRSWYTVDNSGRTDEVSGPGVIGIQPIIQPGECYKYTSATFLNSPFGIMHGVYAFVDTDSKEMFNAEIPAFSLHCNHSSETMH